MSLPKGVHRKLPRRMPKNWVFSNYALLFNSVNTTQVNCGANASLDFGVGDWCMEAWIWFNVALAAVHQPIILKSSDSLPWHWYLAGTVAGKQRMYYNPANFWTGNTTVVDSRWHHIACLRRGDDLEFYRDGVSDGVLAGVLAALSFTTANPLIIGGRGGFDLYADGIIDEIRILPMAPTAYQILESFRRGYAKMEFDARLVLRMEEGTGLTTRDTSGYGNSGSLLPIATPPTWRPITQYELLAESGQ